MSARKHFTILLLTLCSLQPVLLTAQNAAIQLTTRNLLYVGESIPVKVAIAGVQQGKVIVKVSDNMQFVDSDSGSTLAGLSKGVGLMRVGYKKRKDTIWVDSLYFRIKSLPPLRAKYGTIESGKRIHRNAIAIQRSIRVGYGDVGIPIKQQWKVLSFRIKIQGVDSYKTYNLEGSGIPLYVGNYISRHATGFIIVDKIIVQNKTSLQTKTVSPITIDIASKNVKNKIRYLNANYVDTNGIQRYYNLLTDYHFFDTIFSNIDSGTVETFGLDYRFECLYRKGVVEKKSHYDQYGRLNYSMYRLKNHIWKFEKVDSSGATILETSINDTLNFFGAKEINCYLDNPFFKCTDTTQLGYHLITFFNQYKLCPIESFVLRYPNGSKRLVGNLRIREGTHVPWESPRCGNIGIEELVHDVSVMDGTWTLYRSDGSVIERQEYDLGVSKKQ